MSASILFVEDDTAFQYTATKVLKGAGFEVVEAPDFLTALNAIERKQGIDLLLTDVVMPNGVNGFALARMAKLRRRSMRVLYITAYDVPAHEADGKILRKPIAPDALIAEVHSALA